MDAVMTMAYQGFQKGGVPGLTPRTEQQPQQSPSWRIVKAEQGTCLERTYRIHDFAHKLVFVNKVRRLAQDEGSTAEIVNEWGKVTVRWWKQSVEGLDRDDFVRAARTDQLYY